MSFERKKCKKPCDPDTEVCNPKHGRCIKIKGATYKKLIQEGVIQPKKDINLCALRKTECPKGTKCNKDTGRCIKIGGKTDKAKAKAKTTSTKTSVKKQTSKGKKGSSSTKKKKLDFESDDEEEEVKSKPTTKKSPLDFESDDEEDPKKKMKELEKQIKETEKELKKNEKEQAKLREEEKRKELEFQNKVHNQLVKHEQKKIEEKKQLQEKVHNQLVKYEEKEKKVEVKVEDKYIQQDLDFAANAAESGDHSMLVDAKSHPIVLAIYSCIEGDGYLETFDYLLHYLFNFHQIEETTSSKFLSIQAAFVIYLKCFIYNKIILLNKLKYWLDEDEEFTSKFLKKLILAVNTNAYLQLLSIDVGQRAKPLLLELLLGHLEAYVSIAKSDKWRKFLILVGAGVYEENNLEKIKILEDKLFKLDKKLNIESQQAMYILSRKKKYLKKVIKSPLSESIFSYASGSKQFVEEHIPPREYNQTEITFLCEIVKSDNVELAQFFLNTIAFKLSIEDLRLLLTHLYKCAVNEGCSNVKMLKMLQEKGTIPRVPISLTTNDYDEFHGAVNFNCVKEYVDYAILGSEDPISDDERFDIINKYLFMGFTRPKLIDIGQLKQMIKLIKKGDKLKPVNDILIIPNYISNNLAKILLKDLEESNLSHYYLKHSTQFAKWYMEETKLNS